MTEFSDLGAHCDACGQQDFLPFRCSDCGKNFCNDHRTQADHKCPSLLAEAEREERKHKRVKTGSKAKRCKFKTCKKRSMVLEECRDCGMEFCATHRFTDDHRCRGKRAPLIHGAFYGTPLSADADDQRCRETIHGAFYGTPQSADTDDQRCREKRAPLIHGAFYGTPLSADADEQRCREKKAPLIHGAFYGTPPSADTDDQRCREERAPLIHGAFYGTPESADTEMPRQRLEIPRQPLIHGAFYGTHENADTEMPHIHGAFYGTPLSADTERCKQEAEDLELALRLQRSLYGCGMEVHKETDRNDYIINYAY